MDGHDAIAQALTDQGIDTMFGVLGDGNLFIAESMMRNHGLHYVAATHEANAVLMAEGWGRAAGRLGVATVTHGPGLTNTVTALVEGVKNRTPLLLVSGDTPAADRDHLQNLDQHAVVAATGAGFEPIHSSTTIAADVATAVRRAHAERRPIVLNVPLNIEWEHDVELQPVGRVEPPARAVAPDPAALDVAVGILATATRPLVLVGRGAVLSGAHDEVLALAQRLGAPTATTLLGSGYLADDPCNLGFHGTLSSPVALDAITSADCVITFGASLNRFTTDEGSLFRDTQVIQCDVDPTRIGSTVPIAAGVVGDAARVATTITQWLDEAGHTPAGFRSEALAQELAAYDPAADFTDLSRQGAVDPRTFTLRLDEILPDDRTVVGRRRPVHAPGPYPARARPPVAHHQPWVRGHRARPQQRHRGRRGPTLPPHRAPGRRRWLHDGRAGRVPHRGGAQPRPDRRRLQRRQATGPSTSSSTARTWTPRHRSTTGPICHRRWGHWGPGRWRCRASTISTRRPRRWPTADQASRCSSRSPSTPTWSPPSWSDRQTASPRLRSVGWIRGPCWSDKPWNGGSCATGCPT